MDGSIKMSAKDFEKTKIDFFRKSQRYTKFKDQIYLRGARYLVSIDPTLEVRQKLRIMEVDFSDAISELYRTDIVNRRAPRKLMR